MINKEETQKAHQLYLHARRCATEHFVFVPAMEMCDHCIEHCVAYKAHRAKFLAHMKYLRDNPPKFDEYDNVL